VLDLANAISAFELQRLTVERPPRGEWVAVAITSKGHEARGSGPALEAALIEVFAAVTEIESAA
jgi:hypothetical protein